VEGSSMLETLVDKEYIIINKLAYYIGTPARGDVVVFHPPSDSSKYYVKRVIGAPGDDVILEGGSVYIRKADSKEIRKLEENEYLVRSNEGKTFRHPITNGDTSRIVYKVPEGKYFLLGDNRLNSHDSRSFMTGDGKPDPYVSRNQIKGKVWFVALPITKIHAIESPKYAQ
jgi:signal peptidase I